VKKLLQIALGILMYAWLTLASAATIVVLNPEKAVFATDKAQQLGQELAASMKPQTSRYDEMGQQLQSLQQQLQQDQALLSATELTSRQQQFQALEQEYQQLGQHLLKIKVQQEQKFLVQMKPALDRVLSKLIEMHKISLILNPSAIVFAVPGIDITAEVVGLLNQEPLIEDDKSG
jgi:Skp family chaperone for outer membrane proteins